MPKYTIQDLESALEQITNNSDELSVLFRKLINEKLALLKKAGKPKSEVSARERKRIAQAKWRAKKNGQKLVKLSR